MKKSISGFFSPSSPFGLFLFFNSKRGTEHVSHDDERVGPEAEAVAAQRDGEVRNQSARDSGKTEEAADASVANTSPYRGKLATLRRIWDETKVFGGPEESDGTYRRSSFYRADGLKYKNIRFDEVFSSNPAENADANLLRQEAYVADHFLIRVKEEQRGLVDALLNRFDDLAVRRELSGGKYVLVEFPLRDYEVDTFSFWESRLASHGLAAKKDYLAYTTVAPADPDYSEQWALENTGQDGGTVDADIDADQAWDIQSGSSDVIVAVLDTGIDLDHPDLISRLWRSGTGANERQGFDATTGTFSPVDEDSSGHGTHVSGIIGARANNGQFIAGANWDLRIMAVKVFTNLVDPETEEEESVGILSDIIEGLDFAVANGASIVNMSLGILGVGENDESDPFYAAIRDARDNGPYGVLVTASAGNDGIDLDAEGSPGHFPSGYALDNIISVAASDRNDERAAFSNFGVTEVDLAAPGDSILSTIPDDTTGLLSGTSMAAPYVAGVAALLKAEDENQTYSDLKTRILNSVDQPDALKDTSLTDGRLNAYNPLLSFGSGAVRVSGIDLQPLGNGDEFWTEMEALSVDVGLQNFGGDEATNVSVEIEITDGNATVSSSSTFNLSNPLAAGDEVFLADAFELTSGDLDQFDFSDEVEIKVTVNYDGGEQTEHATLSFFQIATLSGVIRDGADNSPIEGAVVDIFAQTSASETIELEILTGPDGAYNVSLFTGLVSIQARAEGYEDSVRKVVDLNPVEPNQTLDIILGVGNFNVIEEDISVTVPPDSSQKLDLHIQNLSTFTDPLQYNVEVSEDNDFFGASVLYGLSGLGVNVPELVRINQFTVTPDSVEPLALPAGFFSVDFTAFENSLWVLALTGDGSYALCEYDAQTLNLLRVVDLHLGLIPTFGGGFINNDDVSVETVFVLPIPDEDEPSGFRLELAVITHDTDEIFNVFVYAIDPETTDIVDRERRISALGINTISWFSNLRRRSATYGGERDSFFYGRGVLLYEYEITGETGSNELKQSSIFDFEDELTFFFEDFDFNVADVKSLAYFGNTESLFILLRSGSRNLISVDWDSDTLVDVFDAPADIDRITTSSGSTELDWLKLPFTSGNLEHESTAEFTTTVDTSELSRGDRRSGFVRLSSPNSETEDIVSVVVSVGDLGFNDAFRKWYQQFFADDPTSVALDSDGGGNADALEFVTGSDPTRADDDKPVPTVIFDSESPDQDIFLKFRQRKDLEDGVVTIQGRSSLTDPWVTLEEGIDYEVIFSDPVNETVNELTVSTPFDGVGFFRLVIDL